MSKIVIASSLVLGVVALAAATSQPAQAFKPGLEKCHFETKCHTVTPPCPQTNTPKPKPCQGPQNVCHQEKVCND